MGELSGKAVVVTGAGRSIGAACARSAAARGAAVLVNDIDAAAARAVAGEIAAARGLAEALPADVAVWSQAEGLIGRALEAFGRLDGLVNNAGTFGIGRLDEIGEGDIRRLVDVNLLGVVNCAAHAVRPMR